jgi:hypothetical protein
MLLSSCENLAEKLCPPLWIFKILAVDDASVSRRLPSKSMGHAAVSKSANSHEIKAIIRAVRSNAVVVPRGLGVFRPDDRGNSARPIHLPEVFGRTVKRATII